MREEFEPLSLEELSELLPNLEILSMIGRGGMGLVYMARQANLDRAVALKLLPIEAALDPEFEERFMREARTMAKLDHANIAHIYDFGEADGQYYIIMEYVEGQTLSHHLMHECLTASESFALLLQVCEALSYAHSRGVVHRDVKPGNIMITPEGRVKVMDFGLAKLVHAEPDRSAITKTNASLGTPHYMAPEQHQSLQITDQRADIYALGVVFYEMLTGSLPIGHYAPPSDKALVPTAVDTVIERALQADLDKRYGSVREFRDDLLIAMEDMEGTVSEKQMVVLLFTDIVGSVGVASRMGTEMYVACISRHDAIIKDVLEETAGARVLQHTGDGFLIKLTAPSEGVAAALKIQYLITHEPWPEEPLQVRIGVHLGEVIEITEQNTGVTKPVGFAINFASRVCSLAQANQILLTRAVFDDARQYLREHPLVVEYPDSVQHVLQWPAHGRYLFQGNDEPMDIFEVGIESLAPLSPPPDSEKAKRAVAPDEEQTLGWRPGAGLEIPMRSSWTLLEKLGRGGFGEVWLAQHRKTKEKRAFKFCFDPLRLRSFRRELTLFRLLRDALGKRRDIATIHEVQVESAPFYLESDYLSGGNLAQWFDDGRTIDDVSMATRLRLMAKVARAVAAAHSVGIIHKDIKPSNILIEEIEGEPEPCITDFGIGNIHSSQKLEELGITHSGFTESLFVRTGSGDTGTRLYSAPEYLVGGQPTVKGDVYALGIMLYQLVIGDLHQPLGSGWRRDIEDSLVADDIAQCVDVDPERRFDTAAMLAENLETLDSRRETKEREDASLRRRRWFRVAALVGASVSAFLGYGYYQSVQSERLAREAQGRAEDLVDFMVQDLYEQLEPIGRLDVIDNVVGRVRQHYNDYPDELVTDEILLRESAVLTKLSVIRRDQGDIDAAIRLLDETAREKQRLVDRNPNNGAYKDELAGTLDATGVVRYRSGDFEGAEKAYMKAIAIRESLSSQEGAHPEWENGLANVYNNLASMLQNRGRLEEARSHYAKAIATRERLIEEATTEEARHRWQYIQSWGQNNFGWFHLHNGDLDAAEKAFNLSKALTDGLIPTNLENKGYRLSRGTSSLGLGDVHILRGAFPTARASIDVSIHEMQTLTDGDPENVNWRWRLSDAYRSQGRWHLVQSQLTEAQAAYQNAYGVIVEFASMDPSNLRLQWQLGEALAGMARAGGELEARGAGISATTVERAAKAIAISDALVAKDDENTTWRLANAIAHMVDARLTQVRHGAAAALPQMEVALDKCEGTKAGSLEVSLEHLEIACRHAEMANDPDAYAALEPLIASLRKVLGDSLWLAKLEAAANQRGSTSAVLYPSAP